MKITKLFSSAKLIERSTNCCGVVRNYCSSKGTSGTKEEKTDSNKKGLVVGVYKTKNTLELTPIAQEINQKSGDKLTQHLNKLCGELRLGKAFTLTDVMPEYSAIAITCFGPKDAGYNALESLDEARENIRWGVGAGVKLLKARGCGVIEVDPANAPDAAAEAAELAAWRFQKFKTKDSRKTECHVKLYGNEGKELWKLGAIYGEAQNWARYLSDMPANKMTPVDLAQAAIDVLCPLGVSVEAHDREWIRAQRMQAFLAVARGSCDTPMFLECIYRPGAVTAAPVLLAAKGVTFDSGGLCLKDCNMMLDNRGSMAGAAVVLAAIKIIAKLKLPINVSAVIPICENMVSGQCMKVGDVVRALNGLSIEIENTDMEGRLMMADALVYGQSLFKPAMVIDVATFTHGVLMATGGGAFGCFSNSESAWRAVQAAGVITGDRPWRFPLWKYFHKQITNDPAVDLRNKGSGHGTPCLGAAFLKNFVCCDWVHMDITGVGKVSPWGGAPYLAPRRMSGRPARTLAALLHHLAAAANRNDNKQEPTPCAAKS
ncbi:cytosol aminopeptidase-like [Spodoptera litura]|uniref:Cytosol aminopeptidase n=1 Tax=Spodoptera litura TaxID=69820 RepID=A0A9J7EH99_SPOLT|nr:cytosol aminopeptidase-like [Spodoptera litura]